MTYPADPISLLTRADPNWPGRLDELEKPPEQIAVRGSLPTFNQRVVAIVGTRRVDTFGRDFTFELARDLARQGWVVVSGGAVGVDTAAHLGALEGRGVTVAVLPTGVRHPYPQRNHPLFQRIFQEGALLSEAHDTIPAYPSTFLERNRLIAALSDVVVVTQAPHVSGAMSTAAYAKQLGRTLLAVPYAPGITRGDGCLTLLTQGAGICRTARDVLSVAAPRPAQARPKRTSNRTRRPKKTEELRWLDEDESALVRALTEEPLDADTLCEATGLPAPRVQRAIFMLLLSKVIQEVGGGRYTRTIPP